MLHRARDQPQASLPYIMNILVDLTMFVLYDFSCVVLCDFLIQVKAQRLFRYKKNIKISQKVIKKTTKVNTLRFIDYFNYQLCVWYFMIIFPFFYFVTDKYFSSQGAKEHLMNYNTTICWQCELAPFFSLIVELRWNYCIFCSFILFCCWNISCVRV